MPSERRVLARLVGSYVGTSRGVFELGDGTHVEVEGTVDFESSGAPAHGEKVLIVMDASGQALRWEPYPGAAPSSTH